MTKSGKRYDICSAGFIIRKCINDNNWIMLWHLFSSSCHKKKVPMTNFWNMLYIHLKGLTRTWDLVYETRKNTESIDFQWLVTHFKLREYKYADVQKHMTKKGEKEHKRIFFSLITPCFPPFYLQNMILIILIMWNYFWKKYFSSII